MSNPRRSRHKVKAGGGQSEPKRRQVHCVTTSYDVTSRAWIYLIDTKYLEKYFLEESRMTMGALIIIHQVFPSVPRQMVAGKKGGGGAHPFGLQISARGGGARNDFNVGISSP